MKNRNIIISLGIIVMAFACQQVVSENQSETSATPVKEALKTVQVTPVKSVPYNNNVYAIGRLASKEESKLSFKTGGVVKRIHVREGQNVGAGTVLAELDLEEVNAQVQKATVGQSQAEIQFNSAQLMVEKLQRDYETVKALYEDKVATLTELKDTKSALDNAKNQVEAARTGMQFSQENQKIANYNKRLSKIVAPSAGVILKRLAEPNEIIGPGTPVFFFGSKKEALVLKASVTDKDIIHLSLGNTAEIKFDAYPDQFFHGKISEIAGIADPYTGTYEIEISLAPTNQKLLSGFIGEATVASNNQSQTLSIPIDAMISAHGNSAKVYIVQNGIVKPKTIRIGPIQGDKLIVIDGLSQGDQVITKGANYIAPNDSVNTEMK